MVVRVRGASSLIGALYAVIRSRDSGLLVVPQFSRCPVTLMYVACFYFVNMVYAELGHARDAFEVVWYALNRVRLRSDSGEDEDPSDEQRSCVAS